MTKHDVTVKPTLYADYLCRVPDRFKECDTVQNIGHVVQQEIQDICHKNMNHYHYSYTNVSLLLLSSS